MRTKLQKGFVHIILIIVVVVVLAIVVLPRLFLKTNSDKKGMFSKKIGMMYDTEAKNVPDCPADTSNLFTKPFMDGDYPDYIIPLGNSYTGGHVIPTDHIYPTDFSHRSHVPVYAPGDITLVWFEIKQIRDSKTDAVIGPDYQLNFAPCKGINLAFIHFSDLSPTIKNAIDFSNLNCDDQKSYMGSDKTTSTYYVTCHPSIENVRVKAGDIIGYFGDLPNREKPQVGFDIGLYDYNKPTLGFINPDRYYYETTHTVCPFDYYTSELKAKYLAKMGDFQDGTFVKRNIEPVCGMVMYDKSGTAAGDWFKNPVKQAGMTDQDSLVLVHDNVQPEKAKISTYNTAQIMFIPTHSGTFNREFTEVTADGKIYCYSQEREGKGQQKVLIQVLDKTHIKWEEQQGTCSGNESFVNALTYQR